MNEARPIEAVLIDLDGTLMDTVPDLAAAANCVRAERGLPPLSLDRIASFVGKGAEVLIHRFLTDDFHGNADETAYGQAQSSFFRHYHDLNGSRTVVYGRVPDALRMLHEAGLKLACVTNKPREFTLPLLDRLGLARWFTVVVAGDDVQRPKPDPALLLMACERLCVIPLHACMVGDSVNDALAAQGAGMPVILVEGGYNEGNPVRTLAQAPGVIGIVPSLYEAARRLVDGSC